MNLICCQIIKKGRFVSAAPWFEQRHPISIGSIKEHQDHIGKLCLVEADANSHKGRIVEVLGLTDSIHAVMRGLLVEKGRLQLESSLALKQEIEELPKDIPFVKERVDHRSDLVVTIDPVGAKDHDDAIGIIESNDSQNTLTICVHIADVSAYVNTGSAIDTDAFDKAFSSYVPGTVAPMLPHELSSELCSLKPGVDRGCVSVFVDLNQDAEILNIRFERTLIRSARRLTYDDVDRIIKGSFSVDPVVDELIFKLDEVTTKLRSLRLKRGALDMALPEVELTLDDKRIVDAKLSTDTRSHQLVEECMLLANEAVGAALVEADAPGVWRLHDHPNPEAIRSLFVSFDALGIPTPNLPDEFFGKAAAKLAAEAASKAARYAKTKGRGESSFAPRVLRALERASYKDKSGTHSGLAVRDYCHFTSPIRRYTDLIVHRSLLNIISDDLDLELAACDISSAANHANDVELELQKLERQAKKIATAYLLHYQLYSEKAVGDTGEGWWKGEIVGLIGGGLFVRFGDVFEGFIPIRRISRDERYELDQQGIMMVGKSSGHRLRLGDRIDVYVDKIDRCSGRIDLRVRGQFKANKRRR